MENLNVTVYKNHEDTRESWRVVADADGNEVGSVQIRRMTENKAIAFIFALDVAEPEPFTVEDWQDAVSDGDTLLGFDAWTGEHIASTSGDKAAIVTATVQRIIENAPKHNIAFLQTTANVEDIDVIEALYALGFVDYATFVNPNTGNTLSLFGKTL